MLCIGGVLESVRAFYRWRRRGGSQDLRIGVVLRTKGAVGIRGGGYKRGAGVGQGCVLVGFRRERWWTWGSGRKRGRLEGGEMSGDGMRDTPFGCVDDNGCGGRCGFVVKDGKQVERLDKGSVVVEGKGILSDGGGGWWGGSMVEGWGGWWVGGGGGGGGRVGVGVREFEEGGVLGGMYDEAWIGEGAVVGLGWVGSGDWLGCERVMRKERHFNGSHCWSKDEGCEIGGQGGGCGVGDVVGGRELPAKVNKARDAQIHWGSLFGKSHNALGYSTFRCYPDLRVLQIGIRAKVIENQDYCPTPSSISLPPEAEVERHLAMTTPSPSPPSLTITTTLQGRRLLGGRLHLLIHHLLPPSSGD
ncbi:hypothetical protein Tco_0435935 [Tanacetum coccineum]